MDKMKRDRCNVTNLSERKEPKWSVDFAIKQGVLKVIHKPAALNVLGAVRTAERVGDN